MPSYSQCTVVGNLVRDPEVRFLANEKAVSNVTVAINEKYTKQNGEQQENTTYLDCVLWGRLGELIGQYAKRGDPILLAGNLRQENWEAQDGSKRSKIVLNVRDMQFLGSRNDGQRQGQPQAPQQSAPAAVPPPADLGDDDGVPF